MDCEEKRYNNYHLLAICLTPKKYRIVTRQVAEDFAREQETIYFEVSAKLGDNVHNLFNTIASVLPGNENNRAFATDHSNTF